jgi:NADH:ubiquinone oxidoreductase subunit F (NADH-binding)/(2Fe-2S) ferredoxin/NAD-dependent dihydropyrimidine dehydrogenase PreA subunit
MERISSIEKLDTLRDNILLKQGAVTRCLTLCGGTGCRAYGCMEVVEAFKKELKKRGLTRKVTVKTTGCHGFCERGPMVLISPEGIFYEQISTKDVPEIVEKTLLEEEVVDRLVYKDPNTGKPILKEIDIPFYRLQNRFLLGENLVIDPTSIDDYIAQGGYKALWKALTQMSPEKIIDEVKLSGLRGRGGGGFPTGRKWESCRKAEDLIKYVICNADEGDPGAYMDRSLLEGNPHKILEGMIIGAYAIGAQQGYIYVRNEYPLAVTHATQALKDARKYGFLGKDIFGSGFDFDVKITRGGGAFVCGESSALMASLEGRPGEPRAKYVHTVEKGLFDLPTTLNNVESWANVPRIVLDGASKFAQMGTKGSKGTKIFSLVGKINNTGLVEVPMGMTLRKIIFDIGGGVPDGKAFKAVQTGGPSGGCLPEHMLDLTVDFDELAKAGSMMGSGGMIVMDEENCMVDVARYFVTFLEEESCGKCTPCREGLRRMKDILTDVCEGRGTEDSIEQLERLSVAMKAASLCELGRTAANPVLTTIQYFRGEYETHIRKKKCPAFVCRQLVHYSILAKKCTGCQACVRVCPANCISGKKKVHVIDQALCIHCGSCFDVCRFDAVKRK